MIRFEKRMGSNTIGNIYVVFEYLSELKMYMSWISMNISASQSFLLYQNIHSYITLKYNLLMIFIAVCFPNIVMAWCKTALTPVLAHWIYCSLAVSHRLMVYCVFISASALTVQIWRYELELSEFLDGQFSSCTPLPFYDDVHLQSMLILVTTSSFKFLQLHLWLQNLSPEPVTACELSLIALTQMSELKMGQGHCYPFCGTLTRCNMATQSEINASLRITEVTYSCHCQVHHCQSVAIHVPKSAVQNNKHNVGLCHIELSPPQPWIIFIVHSPLKLIMWSSRVFMTIHLSDVLMKIRIGCIQGHR